MMMRVPCVVWVSQVGWCFEFLTLPSPNPNIIMPSSSSPSSSSSFRFVSFGGFFFPPLSPLPSALPPPVPDIGLSTAVLRVLPSSGFPTVRQSAVVVVRERRIKICPTCFTVVLFYGVVISIFSALWSAFIWIHDHDHISLDLADDPLLLLAWLFSHSPNTTFPLQ